MQKPLWHMDAEYMTASFISEGGCVGTLGERRCVMQPSRTGPVS